jgi:hypothetical protein
MAETSDQATIWRFRPDYQYDFAARMDCCSASSVDDANHNLVPTLNGEASTGVAHLTASAGSRVALSAEGTLDPEDDSVSARWYPYPEAGTLPEGASLSAVEGLTTEVVLPENASGTLHVILEVRDDGTPTLSAYRRAVVEVAP